MCPEKSAQHVFLKKQTKKHKQIYLLEYLLKCIIFTCHMAVLNNIFPTSPIIYINLKRYIRLCTALSTGPCVGSVSHPEVFWQRTRRPATMACSPGDVPTDEINDPGAAPYGNFINYYSFNPPENRLSLIPASLLQDLGYRDEHQPTLILDVGCNSGVRGEKHSQV